MYILVRHAAGVFCCPFSFPTPRSWPSCVDHAFLSWSMQQFTSRRRRAMLLAQILLTDVEENCSRHMFDGSDEENLMSDRLTNLSPVRKMAVDSETNPLTKSAIIDDHREVSE